MKDDEYESTNNEVIDKKLEIWNQISEENSLIKHTDSDICNFPNAFRLSDNCDRVYTNQCEGNEKINLISLDGKDLEDHDPKALNKSKKGLITWYNKYTEKQ